MPANLGPFEIFLIVAVLLLLFGAKRLPDTARGLGRSLRIFKAETKGLREDEKQEGVEVRREVVTETHADPAPPVTLVIEAQPVRATVTPVDQRDPSER